MINRPNNWDTVKEATDRPQLPVGAYVCKALRAVVQGNDYGAQLCILFDIVEGEFKNYFENEYSNNPMTDRKWKGVLRLWLPKDDGSEKDEWTKSTFKGMTTAFEKSNPGYRWNWDEGTLAGKLLGIVFRNEEWEYEGKTGWKAKPFKAIDVNNVRAGTFTLPKDKPLKKSESAGTYSGTPDANYQTQEFAAIADDNDLPF